VSAAMKIDETTREALLARLRVDFDALKDVFEDTPQERIVISYGG